MAVGRHWVGDGEEQAADLADALLGDYGGEEVEDIDDDGADIDAGAAPLLRGSDSDGRAEPAPSSLLGLAGGMPRGASALPRWLVSGSSGRSSGKKGPGAPKKVKGVCPLCRQLVGSGSHRCSSAEWRVWEGQKSDAARADGNALFRQGRYEEAAAAYSEALNHSPCDAKLWSNRAAALTILGEFDKALADCEATIRLAPSWTKGYYRKALLFEGRREWSAATQVYEELLEKCPMPEEATAKARRRLPLMRARFQAVVQASGFPSPFCDEAVRERWQGLVASGAMISADIAECERRLKAAEDAKVAGNEEVGRSNWPAASANYTRGLVLLNFCPKEPWREQAKLEAALRLNMALCEEKVGRHLEAASLCAEVLLLEPTNVKARFRRATALCEMQDFDAGLEETELALAIQPREAALLALRQRLLQQRQAYRRKEKAQFARIFENS
mmetsp:Transcript_122626/g.318852  ORF Transcript_122626/g.318852 Transcript_122626/m.318852 type:complete len:445 (-) Transcript_122626:25-1359(-)